MAEEAPRPTGRVYPADITGHLMAWDGALGQPVLARLPGGGYLLPIFSSLERLREGMACIDARPGWTVKQVDDPAEFLESVRCRAVVGVDLRRVGDKYRYSMVEIDE